MKLDVTKFIEGVEDVNDPEKIIFNRVLQECSTEGGKYVGETTTPCGNCGENKWRMDLLSALDDEGEYLDEYYENSGVEEDVRVYVCTHCHSWEIVSDC